MSDLPHLLATKQYFVAVWRHVSPLPIGDRRPLKEVDEIVMKAIADGTDEELKKIMKQFSAYVGEEATIAATTHLAETTQVDLHPDVRDD